MFVQTQSGNALLAAHWTVVVLIRLNGTKMVRALKHRNPVLIKLITTCDLNRACDIYN